MALSSQWVVTHSVTSQSIALLKSWFDAGLPSDDDSSQREP